MAGIKPLVKRLKDFYGDWLTLCRQHSESNWQGNMEPERTWEGGDGEHWKRKKKRVIGANFEHKIATYFRLSFFCFRFRISFSFSSLLLLSLFSFTFSYFLPYFFHIQNPLTPFFPNLFFPFTFVSFLHSVITAFVFHSLFCLWVFSPYSLISLS